MPEMSGVFTDFFCEVYVVVKVCVTIFEVFGVEYVEEIFKLGL